MFYFFSKMFSINEENSTSDIFYLNFNQTASALSLGSKTGYMLYDVNQIHECRPTYESRNVEDISIIERNFSMSLVAYVSLHSPRNLVLYNYDKGEIIIEKLFPNTVLSVKLNRHNIVVCLEDSLYILYPMNLIDKKMHSITNTPLNVKGICALTYGNQNSFLAYPGSTVNGDVQIFDALERQAKMTIQAHSSQLAALAFDAEGDKLATASIKGTVIRVFCVATGKPLFEFRRGVKRCVEIHSLFFNKKGDFLCAASNTETVHIFKLCISKPLENMDPETEGWMEMFGRVLSQSAKYLPTQMTEVLTQQRSFATVHLPFIGEKHIAAISEIQTSTYVLVASLEGFLYMYELDIEKGGPCSLIKQHRLEVPKPFLVTMPLSSAIPYSLSSKSKSIPQTKDSPKTTNKVCHENQSTSNPQFDNGKPFSEEEIVPVGLTKNELCLPLEDELPPLLNKVES